MIRKAYASFLLPILLLVSQQGAVTHEFGHFAKDSLRAQLQDKRKDQQQLPSTTCEKCVVYAHLSGAVAPEIPTLKLPPLAYASPGHAAISPRSTDSPTARSRGPPSVL
jgi:hypothetical protein